MKKNNFWDKKEDELGWLGNKSLIRLAYTKSGVIRANDQYKWILDVMNTESFPEKFNPKNVLDVGSGYGGNIKVWHNKGFDIEGIEPDEKMTRLVNKSMRGDFVFNTTIDDYNTNARFDLFLLSHVLEHLDLKNFFVFAKNFLDDNGLVFVEAPACDNLDVVRLSMLNESHKHHFLKDELEELFISNGFEIIFSQTLISKLDHVTLPDMTRLQRIFKVIEVLFTRYKSVPTGPVEADVIRLIAKRRK